LMFCQPNGMALFSSFHRQRNDGLLAQKSSSSTAKESRLLVPQNARYSQSYNGPMLQTTWT
jgi:hypothetical protein